MELSSWKKIESYLSRLGGRYELRREEGCAAGSEVIEVGRSRRVKLVKELSEEPEKEIYDCRQPRGGEEDDDESLKSMKNDLDSGEELKGSISLGG